MDSSEIQESVKLRVEAARKAVFKQYIQDCKNYLGQFYAPLRLMYEWKIRSWKEWETIKARMDATGE